MTSSLTMKKNHEEQSKTWTIRKVDAETIEKTKLAAGKSGMKIGAWVDKRLSEAADSSLSGETSPLKTELRNLSLSLDKSLSSFPEDRLAKLEENISQLIRGQHNMFLTLLELQSSLQTSES